MAARLVVARSMDGTQLGAVAVRKLPDRARPGLLIQCYGTGERLKVRSRRESSFATAFKNDSKVPGAPRLAPRQQQGANGSDLGVLGKGKRVFHVDPEIAHRILDLAMTGKDLDGAQVAGRPVDDRRLRSPKRVGAMLASHQTAPCHPFVDKPGILAGAEMPFMINPAWKDIIVHSAPPVQATPVGWPERPEAIRTEPADRFSVASRLRAFESVRR